MLTELQVLRLKAAAYDHIATQMYVTPTHLTPLEGIVLDTVHDVEEIVEVGKPRKLRREVYVKPPKRPKPKRFGFFERKRRGL